MTAMNPEEEKNDEKTKQTHKRKKQQNKSPHVVGIDIIHGKMYKP